MKPSDARELLAGSHAKQEELQVRYATVAPAVGETALSAERTPTQRLTDLVDDIKKLPSYRFRPDAGANAANGYVDIPVPPQTEADLPLNVYIHVCGELTPDTSDFEKVNSISLNWIDPNRTRNDNHDFAKPESVRADDFDSMDPRVRTAAEFRLSGLEDAVSSLLEHFDREPELV